MVEKRQNKWFLQKQHFFVLQQCQNKVSFQRKDSGVVLQVLLIILEGWQCFYSYESTFCLLKNVVEISIRCQSPFFDNLLDYDTAGEQ